ncbi:class I SAM-dependent methyltransferase [Nocardiopsis valliformis]|uniref:class I SAM-dependent methyltransferase n=1 Tax=Nocardiopsis valliformis TaxID=239974 RepID=UPI0003481746|nr:class I SAM-dependent methyltransferase [Nocardiopsis valliformis]
MTVNGPSRARRVGAAPADPGPNPGPGGRDFVRFEKEGWDGIAHAYHRFLGPLTALAAPAVLDAARVEPGCRVLDAATGPGYAAGLALSRGASVTAIDLSVEILALARRLWPGVRLRVADVHALPFGNGAFDATVAGFLVPHMADHARAVGELARVTAPGGRVALSTWDAPARVPVFGLVRAAVGAAGARPDPDVPPGPDFFHYSDPDRLAALLGSAGLRDAEVTAVEFTQRLTGKDALWEGVMSGTVRISALVRGQDRATRERVRVELDRLLEPFTDASGALDLPVSVLVGSARR